MVDSKGYSVRADDGDYERWYLLPDGSRVPSVTTRLRRLYKGRLEVWKRVELIKALVKRDDLIMLAQAGNAYQVLEEAKSRSAANKGTAVHAFVEQYERGMPLDEIRTTLNKHWISGYVALKKQVGWEPLELERELGHPMYGGKVDMVARFPGVLGVMACDLKTGSGVYNETPLQLAAYANAKGWLDDGSLLPKEIRKDIAAVIHVPDDGLPAVRFVLIGHAWKLFRALCAIDDYERGEMPWGETLQLESTPGNSEDMLSLLELSLQQLQHRNQQ